jgi:hypothetical protein
MTSPTIDLLVEMGIEKIPRRRMARSGGNLQFANDLGEVRSEPRAPTSWRGPSRSAKPALTDPYAATVEASESEQDGYVSSSTDERSMSSMDSPHSSLNKLSYLQSSGEIQHSQLVFANKLGEGAFGEVWRALLWDMEVAVKVLKGNFLRTSPLEELAEEVALLK